MEYKAKVSVIIPVYNAEQYLRQCLESVVNQTLKDIEIICVDDGSADGSHEILKEYEKKDYRVKVICQNNKFAGAARNKGLEVAKGEYIVFLDADDFFELSLLEKQYRQAKKMDADICICGADIYDNITSEYLSAPWFLNTSKIKAYTAFSVEQTGNDIFTVTTPVPWNKMFSLEFVKKEKLQFQKTQRANDLFFVWMACNTAKCITYVEEDLVHYRVNIKTNLQSNNHTSPYDFIEALLEVKKELIKRNIYLRVEQGFINHALCQCEFNLKKLINSESFKEVAGKIKEKYIYDLDIAIHNSDYFYNHRVFENFNRLIAGVTVPKISIIIPIYNVEKYIDKCLKSVVEQTFADFEVICVNDGSTDDSMKIVKHYAEKDSRFIIIDKENNEGLLKARKSGVKIAKGEYIIFIDSDDYIATNLCERIKDITDKYSEDIIQFGVDIDDYSNDINKVNWLKKMFSLEEISLKKDELLEAAYIARTIPTVIWGKIYKTAVCKKAYDAIPDIHCFVGEDIFSLYYLAFFADSFRAVETKGLYFYRYGLGVGNNDAMPVQKYELYAKMGELPNYIKLFLTDKNSSEIHTKACDKLIKRLFYDCCSIYETRIEEENKPDAAELLVKYWENPSKVETLLTIYKLEKANEKLEKANEALNEKNKILNQEKRELTKEKVILTKENDSLRNSRSYKIGRFITFVPRKIRGAVKCYKDNDMRYTVRRLFEKISK